MFSVLKTRWFWGAVVIIAVLTFLLPNRLLQERTSLYDTIAVKLTPSDSIEDDWLARGVAPTDWASLWGAKEAKVFLPAKEVPKLSWLDGKGETQTLKQYRGKWVLINFWATWCTPCVEEMPALQTLQENYRQKGLVVLPISEDFGDSHAAITEKISAFYSIHQLPDFPVFVDTRMQMLQALGGKGLPTSYVINPEGDMVARIVGAADWTGDAFTRWLERKIAAK